MVDIKTCHNCNELIGDNADACYKCKYSFKLGRVITNDENKMINEQRENVIKEKREKEDLRQKQLIEIESENNKIIQEFENNKSTIIRKNAFYEYTTDMIIDSTSGLLSQNELEASLLSHAAQGWKLHSIITNEVGKESSRVGISGISGGTNATIDANILIYERCIKKSEF